MVFLGGRGARDNFGTLGGLSTPARGLLGGLDSSSRSRAQQPTAPVDCGLCPAITPSPPARNNGANCTSSQGDDGDTLLVLLTPFSDPDDRLAGGAPLGGERSRRFGERPYGPDDRLEPSVPQPLGEVCQPGTVSFDDKEDSAPILGLDRRHPDGGDERTAGAHQRSRAIEYVASDHFEHHVNLAGVFQLVGLEVQEGVHSQAEGCVAVGACFVLRALRGGWCFLTDSL